MPTPSEPLYREIQLTQGQSTKVSAHRFEQLSKHKWIALWNPLTKSFYAGRNVKVDGKWMKLRMHRFILGLDFGDDRQGDHINCDSLDNRDENLRIATQTQNRRNSKRYSNNTSGFKGVYSDKGRWRAGIGVDGAFIYLGSFGTRQEAYEAYCTAAAKYHREFARTA